MDMKLIKAVLSPLVPQFLLRQRARWRSRRRAKDEARRYADRSPREVFSTVYRQGEWGTSDDFNSGSGSHNPLLVQPYLAAVREYLSSNQDIRAVLDLGCGDFNIGQHLAPLVSEYIACDVVPELISRNKRRFDFQNVTFRVLDIVADPLPPGDIAIVRQVLQHLSNDEISGFLQKLRAYRRILLTEHLPRRRWFIANRDKPAGPGIRLTVSSGVVLNRSPFFLTGYAERTLCMVDVPTTINPLGGVIKTTLYTAE